MSGRNENTNSEYNSHHRSVLFGTSFGWDRGNSETWTMSQEMNEELSKTPKTIPGKLSQNDQSFALKNIGNPDVEKNCLRKLFDSKQRKNVESTASQASSNIENVRKSCIRKALDTKQNDRRVTFSSPIARAKDYFICRSAKSFQRSLYPPSTHPCMVYMGTRLQQERRSAEEKMRQCTTTAKEVK